MNDPTRRGGRPGGPVEAPELALEAPDPHDAARRRADRQAFFAVAAVAALLVAALAVVNVTGGGEGGGDGGGRELAVDQQEADDSADQETDGSADEASADEAIAGIGLLGPRDGLDSKRHPLEVSPADGLVDGQLVRVSGSGFPADEALGVVMCSGVVDHGGGAAQCQLSPFTQVTSGPDGTFEVEFPVRRLIWVGANEVDCASPPPEELASTCVVAVGALADYDESGIAPVSFDAGVPPLPEPELQVSPSADLVDGQLVIIELVDLRPVPEPAWWPMLCATGLTEPPADEQAFQLAVVSHTICIDLVDHATAPQPGMERVEIAIPRWIEVPLDANTPRLDCAAWVGRCWVEVWGATRDPRRMPLSFTADAGVDSPEAAAEGEAQDRAEDGAEDGADPGRP